MGTQWNSRNVGVGLAKLSAAEGEVAHGRIIFTVL